MSFIEDAEFSPEDIVEEDQDETPEVEEEALPEFDPRHRDDFSGLLYLGALTRRFSFWGHKFVLRTLRTEEYLAIGLLMKEYAETPSSMKAYATAVLGAALVTVDGKPLETPFREETALENLQFRMDMIAQWSPFLVDVLYNEYLVLDEKVRSVFESMGKA